MPIVISVKYQSRAFNKALGSSAITIGRSSKCDICVPDGNMSGLHAKVTLVKGSIFLQDVQSKNGILVNNTQFSSGNIFLQDKIVIGDSELNILAEGLSAAERANISRR